MTIEQAKIIAEKTYDKYKAYSAFSYEDSWIIEFSSKKEFDDAHYFFVKVNQDEKCEIFDVFKELMLAQDPEKLRTAFSKIFKI